MNYSTPIIDGYNEIVGPTNNLPLDRGSSRPGHMTCTRSEST